MDERVWKLAEVVMCDWKQVPSYIYRVGLRLSNKFDNLEQFGERHSLCSMNFDDCCHSSRLRVQVIAFRGTFQAGFRTCDSAYPEITATIH
jgi:hypothetical protein